MAPDAAATAAARPAAADRSSPAGSGADPIGRPAASAVEPGAAGSAQPAVEIRGLVKRLRGGVLALDGLDLTVGRGQVFGLAGANGSGKSMTMRILLGLVRPTAGSVRVLGERARPGAPALARVGALVDGPGFVPHLSGLDNLRLGWRLTGRREGDAELEPALALAGLGSALHRPYRTYSHGMRYRLGLAQALMGRPELLILDEPTTGLDPLQTVETHRAIGAAAARGCTVLMSSHRVSEIERLCTHAAVLSEGRCLAAGSLAELAAAVEGAPAGGGSFEHVYRDAASRADGRRPAANGPAAPRTRRRGA